MAKISETPESSVALDFARKVVASRFDEAASLLSLSARKEWSPALISKSYEEMIEYFEGFTPIINEEYVMETYSDDQGKYIYVPLEGDIASEAITVGVNIDLLIFAIEWGRP